jgi:6-phosphogluconolactonase
MLIYVGTYTRGASEGVYVGRFDRTCGTLQDVRLAARLKDPTWVTTDPLRRFLYVGHDAEGGQDGMVSAFAIRQETGRLEPLCSLPTHGRAPCFVTIDATGRCLVVVNYHSEAGPGSVAVYRVRPDGTLEESALLRHEGSGPNARRQSCPHPHSANIDPSGRYVLVPDLGIDRVVIYRMDAGRSALVRTGEAVVEPGSGPRHLRFGPGGRRAYLLNELGNTIMAFEWDAEAGELSHLQTLPTLPAGFSGRSSCAEVRVHPSGRFVYGSNRGHDSIAMFAIDAATGRMAPLGQEPTRGKNPRNFAVDPSGTWLLAAHQDSDNVVTFRIEPQTGRLRPTGDETAVPGAVCLHMVPEPGEDGTGG